MKMKQGNTFIYTLSVNGVTDTWCYPTLKLVHQAVERMLHSYYSQSDNPLPYNKWKKTFWRGRDNGNLTVYAPGGAVIETRRLIVKGVNL